MLIVIKLTRFQQTTHSEGDILGRHMHIVPNAIDQVNHEVVGEQQVQIVSGRTSSMAASQ